MKIATVLFTYIRYEHTKKVLDALKNNTMVPDKLIIFQDGMKACELQEQWNNVSRLINSVDWCDCEVKILEKNRGLKDSIIGGLKSVFQEYDAAIILEDDCVTHPLFMEYMYKALKKYSDEKIVYSINAYAYTNQVPDNGTDAYFIGRTSSWGWGTWKDRWRDFKEDYQILSRIKKDKYLNEQYHIWGEDTESYLLGNIRGECNSWAVFWSLTVIEKKGFCLSPYKSLIKNIGFDGSGEHCGEYELNQNLREVNDIREFIFPSKIEIHKDYETIFKKIFKWTPIEKRTKSYNKILIRWIELNQKRQSISRFLHDNQVSRIVLWGEGNICDLLIKELENEVDILSIVVSEGKGLVRNNYGISVVRPCEISREAQLIIVIPVYDYEIIKNEISSYINCPIVALDELLLKAEEHKHI